MKKSPERLWLVWDSAGLVLAIESRRADRYFRDNPIQDDEFVAEYVRVPLSLHKKDKL